VAARNITEPGLLADMVAYSPDFRRRSGCSFSRRRTCWSGSRSCPLSWVARSRSSTQGQNPVRSQVRDDKTQREYILREQLKAIQRELGEDDPQQAEINELREKVEAAGMPEEVKTRALKEIDRMSRIPSPPPRSASSGPMSTG